MTKAKKSNQDPVWTPEIKDIVWEDAEQTRTAATIDNQRWSGITEESRFWQPVQDAIASGEKAAPYQEPSGTSQDATRRAAILAELNKIDADTLRPLRAVLAGSAIIEDEIIVAHLEERANDLRAELAALRS